jgi:plastocyanin
MKIYLIPVFLLAISLALLSACGIPKPEPVTIQLEMSEYAFRPETIEVKVGQQVTIELVNTGLISHELMIGREVMKDGNRPVGYSQDMFTTARVEPQVSGVALLGHDHNHADSDHSEDTHDHDFIIILPRTNSQATLTFTVTREMLGEWEMGCFEQEGVHYDAGMKGKFIVVP